ncbi:FIST signal transduction protein [Kineococcus sp. SYSU DK004]|uniref:FIST signal transduction protein n=1 Tax=Kineococcus sp. SYSU DK004 TaxID=3383125 RepID=UPI003D7D57A6
MTADRWVSVSSARAVAGDSAGTAAATARAVEDARAGRPAALLLVMARWDLDLHAVARGAQEAAGGAVVAGTSTTTTFAGGADAPADVVVTALGGPGLEARAAASTAADPFARGAEVAAACRGAERAHATHVLLPNGTDGQQQAVVRGAYSELGPGVPIVGGGSDGDLVAFRSWQLLGGQVLENALVGVTIATDRPLGVGAAHGLHRVGDPLVVTDSDGLTVRALDGRPALDVYLERLSQLLGEDCGAASLAPGRLAALGYAHPLGLVRRRREEVRTVTGTDPVARTLSFVSEVPLGSLVHVMAGDEEEMVAGAGEACEQAVAALEGADPVGMVVFSCVARRELLSSTGHVREARSALTAAATDDVVLSYSCGEIARVSGAAGCHNQTVVALAL